MNQIATLSRELDESHAQSDAIVAESKPDAAALPKRLHGNSAPRIAARRLRGQLVAHCGGKPSATQSAIIDAAAELKLRLSVMDAEFIRTGHRSFGASKDYLAWANSLTRLMGRLG